MYWPSLLTPTTLSTERPQRSRSGPPTAPTAATCLQLGVKQESTRSIPLMRHHCARPNNAQALQSLGVDVVEFLDYPDGVIEYSIALRRDIAEAIRRHRPDTVLLFNHRENWGPGHATVPTTRPSVAPHSMRSRMLGTAGFFPEQNLTASSAPSSPGHLSRPTRSTYLLELTSPSLRCPNIAPTSKALANTRWQIPNSFEDS